MIKKIVLTGGPSSGKTKVLEKIQEVYKERGVKVIVVDETATYLINNDIKCFGDNKMDLLDFQEIVMRMQLAKEEVFTVVAEKEKNKDVIIVYDRGTIDNNAYINNEEFLEVLRRVGSISYGDLINSYDLVIFLKGAESFYTLENNRARSETASESMALGNKTLNVWLGHKNIHIVNPKDTIEEKQDEVIRIIDEFILESQIKSQEKYLIDLSKSNMDLLSSISAVAHIKQVYLRSNELEEKRLRKLTIRNSDSYFLSTYKTDEFNNKALVREKKITKDLYEELINFQDEESTIINKTRYYFSYNDEYFQLDVFDEDNTYGLLEINTSKKDNVDIPPFINVIKCVTNDKNYSNKNISFNKNAQRKRIK